MALVLNGIMCRINCSMIRRDLPMNVTFTEKARQLPPDEFFRLEQATEFLKKIAGDSAADVIASWDRSGDLPRHQYKLTLSDWSGEVSEEIFADRLQRDR